MDNEIYMKGFFTDWVKMRSRNNAVGIARALFRYMGNIKSYEERVKIINENHVKGTSFSNEEIIIRIL